MTLKTEPGKGYALAVANDGAFLPTGFDAGKGLGMKIVHAFVRQIGGELLVMRCAGYTKGSSSTFEPGERRTPPSTETGFR